jgi:DNA polymerase-2
LKNELARYAIKILMNSMYGVLASPNSRFHNRKLSNAITSFGQFFIKLTAEELEKQGYEVIYGDTDSVFVDVKTDDEQEAKNIGQEIETHLNTFMQAYIQKNYARESILQLQFEKHFLHFFMPTVRGSTSGAKKRYAGLRKKADGNTFLDVTGLEIVRSDWTALAKEFQEQLLYKTFAHEPVEEIVKSFVQNLREGNYDDLLIYKKSLRKPLESYTKTTPPHVKAARLLDEVTSKVIYYYITIDGPQPVEKLTSPIDYEHYVEKQLKPIATSLLEVMGKDFETIINGTSQTGLGQFM